MYKVAVTLDDVVYSLVWSNGMLSGDKPALDFVMPLIEAQQGFGFPTGEKYVGKAILQDDVATWHFLAYVFHGADVIEGDFTTWDVPDDAVA